jgi:PKD repeat protein
MKKITLKLIAAMFLLLFGKESVAQCTAGFTYSALPNGQIVFWSTSTPATSLTSYYWTFGNSTTYSVVGTQSATTTYSANGIYTVSLFFMTAPSCSNMVTQTISVSNASGSPCNLVANFTYGQAANGVVNFNNTSTGTSGGVTWIWNFGDSSPTSGAQSPSHTYSANGSYIATLTANNNLSVTCISTKTMVVNVSSYCNLTAGFNYSVNGGIVNFYNTTTPSVGVSYSWVFGNGQNSNATNPSTTYTANGTYNVLLTASTNSFGCVDTVMHTIVITNASTCNINANFSWTQSNGVVSFNNTSTGTNGGTTYSWNFGNGNTSTAMSPQSTYTANGPYVVSMTASNGGTCTSTKTYTVYVGTVCNLNASFSYTQNSNGQVSFVSTSTGTMQGTTYSWSFGDNTNGSGASVNHTYQTGTYYAVLTVQSTSISPTCIDTVGQSITVTNTCVANAGFSVIPTNTPQYWLAIPSSPNNVVNAIWYWGDNSSSNQLYTSHQYSAAGTYDLCLSVTVACGAVHTSCATYSIYKSSGSNQIININVVDPETISGIGEAKSSLLAVYPNPAHGEFTIRLDEESAGGTRAEVINLLGSTLVSRELTAGTKEHKIECKGLTPGVYFLRLSAAGQTAVTRLVIE